MVDEAELKMVQEYEQGMVNDGWLPVYDNDGQIAYWDKGDDLIVYEWGLRLYIHIATIYEHPAQKI